MRTIRVQGRVGIDRLSNYFQNERSAFAKLF